MHRCITCAHPESTSVVATSRNAHSGDAAAVLVNRCAGAGTSHHGDACAPSALTITNSTQRTAKAQISRDKADSAKSDTTQTPSGIQETTAENLSAAGVEV